MPREGRSGTVPAAQPQAPRHARTTLLPPARTQRRPPQHPQPKQGAPMHLARAIRRLALAATVTGTTLVAASGVAGAATSTCTYEPDASPVARVTVADVSGSSELRILRSGQFIAIADGGGAAPNFCGEAGGGTGISTIT